MRKQSTDELLHAQRIIDHLVERDQKVVLPAIAAPPMSWKSAEALCEHVLKNEQDVTASINDLYAMAEKAKDRPGVVMLQWFVTEQMEEEAAARARARTHPPRRQHRRRAADDRSGARRRIGARHAGASAPTPPTGSGRVAVQRWNTSDGPVTERPSRQARVARLPHREIRLRTRHGVSRSHARRRQDRRGRLGPLPPRRRRTPRRAGARRLGCHPARIGA